MTENNVNCFERLAERQHQRKIVREDQEAPRRIITLRILGGIQDGTCFKYYDFFIARETTVCDLSPFRGIQK